MLMMNPRPTPTLEQIEQWLDHHFLGRIIKKKYASPDLTELTVALEVDPDSMPPTFSAAVAKLTEDFCVEVLEDEIVDTVPPSALFCVTFHSSPDETRVILAPYPEELAIAEKGYRELLSARQEWIEDHLSVELAVAGRWIGDSFWTEKRFMEQALARIAAERFKQNRMKVLGRFKHTCADLEATDEANYLVLAEEVGEVARAILTLQKLTFDREVDDAREDLRKEITQVAAIATAWLERLIVEDDRKARRVTE